MYLLLIITISKYMDIKMICQVFYFAIFNFEQNNKEEVELSLHAAQIQIFFNAALYFWLIRVILIPWGISAVGSAQHSHC